MVAMAAILDFRLKQLSYFDLQATLMFPTNFQVNWPFSSEEEAKSIF